MSHDVFICYDKEDEIYARAVSDLLKDNNINAWIQSRDMSGEDSANKITDAIISSKCFVLVYSMNSKNSNHIINETDIAFSNEVPILLFKIDDSAIQRDLEFILISQKKILSYPNVKKQLNSLVKETSKMIEKPIGKPQVGSRYIKIFAGISPKRKEARIKMSIIAAIAIIIAFALIYCFVLMPTGQHTTDDGIFKMDLTGVDISESNGGYHYKVLGESYNLPKDSNDYFMKVKFFDKNDNMVLEVNSTIDEFKFGEICSCDLPQKNITHIGFRLVDIKDNELSKEDYVIE